MTAPTMGTCPRCNGTARRPVPAETRQYIRYNERWGTWGIAGYDPDTDTLPCDNCGGQTMSCKGTGQVRLRPDGTPCLHEYSGKTTRNCYHEYDCKFCGDHYAIDSGD